MYFVVVIMALICCSAIYFILGTAVQATQEAVNPLLASDKWASADNWNSFNLANTFVNNIWVFFLVFLILGLAYYGYVEAQRRGQGM